MATQQIKDILNAEIPAPAYSFRPSRAAPTKSGMTVNRPDNSDTPIRGRYWDAARGKFVGADADTPRVVNGNLLVEDHETELVQYTSFPSTSARGWRANGSFSDFDFTSGAVSGWPDNAEPIIEDTDGNVLPEGFNCEGGNARIIAGFTSAQTLGTEYESMRFIFEMPDTQTGAYQSRATIRNPDQPAKANVEFNPITGEVTSVNSNVAKHHVEKITPRIVSVIVTIDAGAFRTGTSQTIQPILRPDLNATSTNNTPVGIHYGGYRKQPFYGSPIVTENTQVTRGEDNYSDPSISDVWNTQAGSFIVDFEIDGHGIDGSGKRFNSPFNLKPGNLFPIDIDKSSGSIARPRVVSKWSTGTYFANVGDFRYRTPTINAVSFDKDGNIRISHNGSVDNGQISEDLTSNTPNSINFSGASKRALVNSVVYTPNFLSERAHKVLSS